jgi:hypothetical protein
MAPPFAIRLSIDHASTLSIWQPERQAGCRLDRVRSPKDLRKGYGRAWDGMLRIIFLPADVPVNLIKLIGPFNVTSVSGKGTRINRHYG